MSALHGGEQHACIDGTAQQQVIAGLDASFAQDSAGWRPRHAQAHLQVERSGRAGCCARFERVAANQAGLVGERAHARELG